MRNTDAIIRALQNIHGPDQVATRFLSKYNATTIYPARRTLDAMVSAADETVANVTAAIEAAGMTQNTVVLLLSDNGGPIQEPSTALSHRHFVNSRTTDRVPRISQRNPNYLIYADMRSPDDVTGGGWSPGNNWSVNLTLRVPHRHFQ